MSCGCAERREKIQAALDRALKGVEATGKTAMRLYEALGGKPEAEEDEVGPANHTN